MSTDSSVVLPKFPGEDATTLLKRLRRQLDNAGVLSELRYRRAGVTAPGRRRGKARRALKRLRKNAATA